MRQLLNTLFVTSEDAYLSLDGDNVVVSRDKEETARFPLHMLQNVISFSYAGASPALMGACAERGIGFSLCTPRGKFLARVSGLTNRNVLLRREQYRTADDENKSCLIARNMILGKLYNSRWVLERTKRDHGLRIHKEDFENAIGILKERMFTAKEEESIDTLRGIEGVGAAAYFSVFDQMILRNKEDFYFHGRNRRPPLDNMNALLSYTYMLLSIECASALESVGLDSYVGFLHKDRAGRQSLALDLMEEFRSIYADRFSISIVNNRIITGEDFVKEDSGAVRLTDKGRKAILKTWQERKQETIIHPYLKEKTVWGLVPYIQALLLARTLRGDIDGYPPFLWK